MPAQVPKLSLKNNDFKKDFKAAIRDAKYTKTYMKGAYLLPRLPNFPVVDSLWVSAPNTLLLQMKGGRSGPLSESKATTIIATASVNHLIFIVPMKMRWFR